ncbi:MAG: hypothetical protein ACK53L_07685, partial [Pirellulaceae bacterium]
VREGGAPFVGRAAGAVLDGAPELADQVVHRAAVVCGPAGAVVQQASDMLGRRTPHAAHGGEEVGVNGVRHGGFLGSRGSPPRRDAEGLGGRSMRGAQKYRAAMRRPNATRAHSRACGQVTPGWRVIQSATMRFTSMRAAARRYSVAKYWPVVYSHRPRAAFHERRLVVGAVSM